MPDALPAATLPIYPGSGQAPNMLDCIPSSLVSDVPTNAKPTVKSTECNKQSKIAIIYNV